MKSDPLLISLAQGQARIEQQVKDISVRLLGGEGQEGVLPLMFKNHKELEQRVDSLENKKTFASGWIAGAGAVGGAVGGILAWLAGVMHHTPKGH